VGYRADGLKLILRNFNFKPRFRRVTNFINMSIGGAITVIWNDGVDGFFIHKIMFTLLLVPKMLMVLDPSTFQGSP